MKKRDKVWNDLNNLLSHLRAANAVKHVSEYFARFNNDAPPQLIQLQMDRLQKHLDEAEDGPNEDDPEVVTPATIAEKKKQVIPKEVFDAFDELIAANYDGDGATVMQNEVIALILTNFNKGKSEAEYITRQTIFDKNWLNVEEVYRNAGWRVNYDKPAYNESYEASFEFLRKR